MLASTVAALGQDLAGRAASNTLRARQGQAATLEVHQESNGHPPLGWRDARADIRKLTFDTWGIIVFRTSKCTLCLAWRMIGEARQTKFPPHRYQHDALEFQRPSFFPLRCAGVFADSGS